MEPSKIRVGITGGAGFLGSHITDIFVEKGVETVIIDDFSSGKEENIAQHKEKENFKIRRANLLDYRETKDAIQELDLVIHLAAEIGGIGYFHKIPADIISNNDLINRNVFTASVKFDLKRVVYFSSSMVFERADKFPSEEKDLKIIPPPKSAYGFQKLNGEYYCKAFKKQHDLDYTILRPFNAVGPRETPSGEVGHAHVIPDLVRKIIELRQYPLRILGSGDQVRAFTNARDLARGCLLATFSDKSINEDFNLGNPSEITIRDLAKMIWKIAGREKEIKFKHKESFSEDVQKRIPNSDKAKSLLGWEPEISLKESLEEYVEWFSERKD